MNDIKPLQPSVKKMSFAKSIKAVLWSFLGIRKRGGLEGDMQLNPLHVIVAGLVTAALFVGVLVMLAHVVVRHAK